MNRFTLLACASLTAITLSTQMAAAGDFKPYVSVFAGASFLNPADAQWATAGGVLQTPYSVSANTGYILGGAVGVEWNQLLRAELELSRGSWNANGLLSSGVPKAVSGSLGATYLLGNIWLDIHNQSAFTPYVGGGIGAGWAQDSLAFFSGTTWGYGNSKGAGLAFQVGAGVKYAISDSVDIDLGYRYKGVTGLELTVNGTGGGSYKNASMYSHNIELGVTFKF